MDLPVIFSKGWFIYLHKLVLALKHTPPLTELTRKYGMYSKINFVTLVYPSPPSPPPPQPCLFNTHTHTHLHVYTPQGTTQQIGLSPMQFLAILFKMPPPPFKTGVKIIMGV